MGPESTKVPDATPQPEKPPGDWASPKEQVKTRIDRAAGTARRLREKAKAALPAFARKERPDERYAAIEARAGKTADTLKDTLRTTDANDPAVGTLVLELDRLCAQALEAGGRPGGRAAFTLPQGLCDRAGTMRDKNGGSHTLVYNAGLGQFFIAVPDAASAGPTEVARAARRRDAGEKALRADTHAFTEEQPGVFIVTSYGIGRHFYFGMDRNVWKIRYGKRGTWEPIENDASRLNWNASSAQKKAFGSMKQLLLKYNADDYK